MENEDQIFIKLDPDSPPVEFLISQQPLAMIRGGFIIKDAIREAIETGSSYEVDEYIPA